MGILKEVRITAGKYFLNRELAEIKRKKIVSALPQAKSIAILFYLEDDIYFQSIEKLAENLRKDKKSVSIYGLFDSNYIPSYFYPSINRTIITKHDLNWYMKPEDKKIQGFYEKEYDLLLDLSRVCWFPLTWMVALSNAHMKVGRYDEQMKKYYDLMIGNSTIEDTDRWIEQIVHYLNIIKS